MGIFVFPPHTKIPLHDHPGMCVLSRVLYGDLQRLSLDLARDQSRPQQEDDNPNNSPWSNNKKGVIEYTNSSSWLPFWAFSKGKTTTSTLPEGSKRAFKNCIDHLKAPACTALYPYEGNLHEFVAGPHGAAVLDVLLPPYNAERDCTFYEIKEFPKECWIIPTGQPEDFHCLSGQYRDLGNVQDDDDDEDSDV